MSLPTKHVRSRLAGFPQGSSPLAIHPWLAPQTEQAYRLRYWKFGMRVNSGLAVDTNPTYTMALRATRNLPLNSVGGAQNTLEQFQLGRSGMFYSKEQVAGAAFGWRWEFRDNTSASGIRTDYMHQEHMDIMVPMLVLALTIDNAATVITQWYSEIEYEVVKVSIAEQAAIMSAWGAQPAERTVIP